MPVRIWLRGWVTIRLPWVCLWVESAEVDEEDADIKAIDANGNQLVDGDTLLYIKDLIKGAPKGFGNKGRVWKIFDFVGRRP